jgi:hypothetical protein
VAGIRFRGAGDVKDNGQRWSEAIRGNDFNKNALSTPAGVAESLEYDVGITINILDVLKTTWWWRL